MLYWRITCTAKLDCVRKKTLFRAWFSSILYLYNSNSVRNKISFGPVWRFGKTREILCWAKTTPKDSFDLEETDEDPRREFIQYVSVCELDQKNSYVENYLIDIAQEKIKRIKAEQTLDLNNSENTTEDAWSMKIM